MKILIINLTRLGDLIQTNGFVNHLKKLYPDSTIDYLSLSSFSGILKNFDSLNKIITFDDKIILNNLETKPLESYLEVKTVVDELNKQNYDILINPVVSIQSSILSFLINAKDKRGLHFNKYREQVISSKWSAYHLANEHNLGDHGFNLVDIFSGVAGVNIEESDYRLIPTDEAKLKAEKFFSTRFKENKPIVGFHIGASRSNKAWESSKFKLVIRSLLNSQNYYVILFGGYNELVLKDDFGDMDSSDFVNLIGEFKLDELIAHISKLDLFVTNDTGPMHIAASMKVMILNISLGPVSVWETGPYFDNTYILQADIECHPCAFNHVCNHLNCHEFIKPATVVNAIGSILSNDSRIITSENELIWKTQRDIFGFLHTVPAGRRVIKERELFFEFKRAVWGMSLKTDLDEKKDWVAEYIKYLKTFYDVPVYDFDSAISNLNFLVKQIQSLVEQFRNIKQSYVTSKKRIDKIQTKWAVTRDNRDTIYEKAREFKEIYDFFYFAKFRESSLQSENLNTLIGQTISIYSNLELQFKVLIRFLRSK